VPALDGDSHKGQHGRVGVIGGSVDYTGAPYYAAESALRFGADLSFVFCAKQAMVPIKSYSPELMVTAFYDADNIEDQQDKVLMRLHAYSLIRFSIMKYPRYRSKKLLRRSLITFKGCTH
jgi:ATP-dependent NAD(P)H-hydrate dehydratase